jgi:nucleoside-diphosphate-sugar epimerase
MSTVPVTGGSGFIGTYCILQLLEAEGEGHASSGVMFIYMNGITCVK